MPALQQPWQGQRLTLQPERARRRARAQSPRMFPAPCCTLTFPPCPLSEGKRVSRTPIWSATTQQIPSKPSQGSVPAAGRVLQNKLWIKDCSLICSNSKPLQFAFLKVLLSTRVKLTSYDCKPLMVLQFIFKTTKDSEKETFLMKFTY